MTWRELGKAISEMQTDELDDQAFVWPENDTPPRSHLMVLRLDYVADAGTAIIIDKSQPGRAERPNG